MRYSVRPVAGGWAVMDTYVMPDPQAVEVFSSHSAAVSCASALNKELCS